MKHIRCHSGFTLVEVLVGLFCLSFCLLIMVQLAFLLSRFPKENYWNEDEISIRQLQTMLAQSNDLHLSTDTLQFVYRQTSYELSFRQQRLVKQPGYEIFFKDIEEGSFVKEVNCGYVTWRRTIQKKAILYCE